MKKRIALLFILALLCGMTGTAIADAPRTEDGPNILEEIEIETEAPEASPEEIELLDDTSEDAGLTIDDTLLLNVYEEVPLPSEADGQAGVGTETNASGDFDIRDGVLIIYNGPGGDVVIPDGVTRIGNGAFSDCTRLTSVTIPSGVTSVGEYAFYSCASLTSVAIPDSVTSIGISAFQYCTSLISVTIPDSVTLIGRYAFAYCTSLTSVTIPDSVTEIGGYAFYDCASLTSVTIPDSVTGIDFCVFCHCTSLTDVIIPHSVTGIGVGAFEDCTSLVSVTIPDSVTVIGGGAFGNCTSLTNVTIPDSVINIGEDAFRNCTSLTSITIPDSVTSIGARAFYNCTSLTSITIPTGITTIEEETFSDCTSLISVAIPKGVIGIEDSAFHYCTSLVSITIPVSVTSIGYSAFSYCSSLTSVTIPASVTDIMVTAFSVCPNLTIYGAAGSYAETYAKENNIPFVAGSPAPQPTFPITIGNVNASENEYAKFDEPLEQYILNMDSDNCYPDLAYMLMALAGAAYNGTGAQAGPLTVENAGYQSESKELYHITKAYEDLGFTDYQPFNYYNDPNDPAYGADNAAFTIGTKPLSENEALVLIVVRGSYGNLADFTSDWQSNTKVKTDSKGNHIGFVRAANKVYSALMPFMKSRYKTAFIKSKVRYVITGHSRGAAVANLLAVKLRDAGIPNSRVYDYNFACPDTVRCFTLKDLKKGHENIFNICNSADAVSVIPGVIGDATGGMGYTGLEYIKEKFKSLFTSWGKYGTTFFYCNNWKSPQEFDLSMTFSEDSSHDFRNYVLDMAKKPGKFKTWAQIVKRRIKLGVPDGINRVVNILYPSYAFVSGDITKAVVTVDDQAYTGKALRPGVTVILNNNTLKKGADYTVSYKNNVEIGEASVTITGKGDYSGKIITHFKINPRAVTGLKLKAGKRQLTTSWDEVDGVTGYQLQYSLKKSFAPAKEVNISKASTVKKTVKSLKKGRTYYVRVRAVKKADGKNYWSEWSVAKKVKVILISI